MGLQAGKLQGDHLRFGQLKLRVLTRQAEQGNRAHRAEDRNRQTIYQSSFSVRLEDLFLLVVERLLIRRVAPMKGARLFQRLLDDRIELGEVALNIDFGERLRIIMAHHARLGCNRAQAFCHDEIGAVSEA